MLPIKVYMGLAATKIKIKKIALDSRVVYV